MNIKTLCDTNFLFTNSRNDEFLAKREYGLWYITSVATSKTIGNPKGYSSAAIKDAMLNLEEEFEQFNKPEFEVGQSYKYY